MYFRLAQALVITLTFIKAASADCFDKAGSYYRIDPDYLRAISWQESRFRNTAINNKSAGGSSDYCMMQINSKTLSNLQKEYPQLTKQKLMQSPCLCIHIGAMILRRNFNTYGPGWLAVGMYNAGMSNKDTTIQNRYNYAMLIDKHYKAIKNGTITRPIVND